MGTATGEATKYREKAEQHYDGRCDRCGEPTDWDDIEVHHVDRNRANHSLDNLECACVDCHQDEHNSGSPVFGVMVEIPRQVLETADAIVDNRSIASRHEAVNRAIVDYAKEHEKAQVSGFGDPDEAVSAFFGDPDHKAWTRDAEVER